MQYYNQISELQNIFARKIRFILIFLCLKWLFLLAIRKSYYEDSSQKIYFFFYTSTISGL